MKGRTDLSHPYGDRRTELCRREPAKAVAGIGEKAKLFRLPEFREHDCIAEVAEKACVKALSQALLRKPPHRSSNHHGTDPVRESRASRMDYRGRTGRSAEFQLIVLGLPRNLLLRNLAVQERHKKTLLQPRQTLLVIGLQLFPVLSLCPLRIQTLPYPEEELRELRGVHRF